MKTHEMEDIFDLAEELHRKMKNIDFTTNRHGDDETQKKFSELFKVIEKFTGNNKPLNQTIIKYKYDTIEEFVSHNIRGTSDNTLYWLYGTINTNLIIEDMLKKGVIQPIN